jgi:hypothetical protein
MARIPLGLVDRAFGMVRRGSVLGTVLILAASQTEAAAVSNKK